MSTQIAGAGEQAAPQYFSPKRPPVMFIDWFAPLALAVSTLVAMTVVSIGIARAEVLGPHSEGSSATLAIALFVGLLLAGMGGLTALLAEDRRTPGD